MAGGATGVASAATPACGTVLQMSCDLSADPAGYCAAPLGLKGDCLFEAVVTIRDKAAEREAYCAAGSDPAACQQLLGDAEPHLRAYVDAACRSSLAYPDETCAVELAAINTALEGQRLAPPNIDDILADLGMTIDDAFLRNATCAGNAISNMTENLALQARDDSVTACMAKSGSGGTEWYRFTNESAPDGAFSSGNYTRTYSNYLRVKECRYYSGQRPSTHHTECWNVVYLTHKDGSRISNRAKANPSMGAGEYLGTDHPRTRGRANCQYFEGPRDDDLGVLETRERFRCYYVY